MIAGSYVKNMLFYKKLQRPKVSAPFCISILISFLNIYISVMVSNPKNTKKMYNFRREGEYLNALVVRTRPFLLQTNYILV